MSESRRIVVATANTLFGRAVVEDGGIAAIAGADVLLMQELFSPTAYELEKRLNAHGFELLGAGGHFGLAIALKSTSDFVAADTPLRSTVLAQVGSIERTLTNKFSKHDLEYSDLGVLAVQLQTPEGRRLTIATTHLPVVTQFRQRNRFLSQLPAELADPFYDGLLVLTGDMNHWPGPKKADLAFRRAAGLAAVDMSDEITWPSRRSSYLGRKFNRLFGGQLDDILYRGRDLELVDQRVVDVASDHRAVIATFTINS